MRVSKTVNKRGTNHSYMLRDGYGRPFRQLRISVTARCNFNCFYCHNEGIGDLLGPRAPHENEITVDQIERFTEIAQELGVDSVKITGGEPLIRSDIVEIVQVIPDSFDISMTTNGALLAARADELAGAGLNRVNVSLDTLDEALFKRMTMGSITPVLKGISAALKAGLRPIKLNMVLSSHNLSEVEDMLDFVRLHEGLSLQIIDLMPEIRETNWKYRTDIQTVRHELEERSSEMKTRKSHHRRVYLVDGAVVEIVNPVGNVEFCNNCHRLRITHDGHLKGCLNRSDDLIDLNGLSGQQIREAFETMVAQRVPYYGVLVPTDQVQEQNNALRIIH